ncbi:MAG: hypothetical protein AB1449_01170 [Chloroflexota bacterium]
MASPLRAWPYLLLGATLWVVHYWHSAQFGLYEDDLTHFPRAAAMSWGEVTSFATDPSRIVGLYGQGHPLHYTFIYLLANLGWRLAELQGPYWFGFAIEAINALLFYALLRRIHSRALGVLGGLAYVLYSADTTQAFLTHSLGLQPSLTFLLLAAHGYVSGRRWLSYPLAGLALLAYETTYPVFIGLPLLSPPLGRKARRDFVVHLLILGLMLGGFILWRVAVGDDRVGGLTLWQAVVTPLTHMLQGLVVSLGTYLYRPVQALQAMNAEVAVATVIFFGVFTWVIGWVGRETWGSEGIAPMPRGEVPWQRAVSLSTFRAMWAELPQQAQSLLRLAAAGAVMLILAYPLTFTVRAYAVSGRETRVHAAGVVGAALLVGSVVLILLHLVRRSDRRRLVNAGLGLWMGLLAGYGFVVQRDYVLAWQYQRLFWTELLPLIDDADNGTAILVDPSGLADARQIGANTWNLPRVLDQLYVLPEEWQVPPRVFRLVPGWEHRIASEAGLFQLNGATVTAPESVMDRYPSGNVILIESAAGHLSRRAGLLHIPGGDFPLKPVGEPVLPFMPRGLLYSLLILGPTIDAEVIRP